MRKIQTTIFLLMVPVLLVCQPSKSVKKKILVVVSSYGKKEGKLRPGFEFDEFAQAWLVFKANDLDVDVASPKGGYVECDEFNKTKPYNKAVLEDAKAMALLRNTKPTAQINPKQYAAVYIVGGKGAMFDLPYDPSLQEIIYSIFENQQGIVAAVCHGPAALVNVKLNDSTFLISHKTITGFCNEEEEKFGKTWKNEFPFLLEDRLKARMAKYERSEAMLPHVCLDGRLITGQNPYSTLWLAEEIVKALGIKPAKREQYADERSMFLVKRALHGEMSWAKEEISENNKMYDLKLIAVYGYYKLLYANGDTNQMTTALQVIELTAPWFFNENLQLEMAKGYLKLNNKERAKALLQEIIIKKPSFVDAQNMMDEIK